MILQINRVKGNIFQSYANLKMLTSTLLGVPPSMNMHVLGCSIRSYEGCFLTRI